MGEPAFRTIGVFEARARQGVGANAFAAWMGRVASGIATGVAAVLAMAVAGPAEALLIDDFSVGLFSLQGGGAGISASQACGSFCLGGSREVFLQSGSPVVDATAELALGSGEVTSVMPNGGGVLRFGYTAPGTSTFDFTVGAAGNLLEVWFNAFAPGAEVTLYVEDGSGASDTLSQNPVLPAPPARVSFTLSDLAGVDLASVRRLEVSVISPGAGDYHPFLISVPSPDATTSDFTLLGPASTSGPPYPSEAIMLQACDPQGGGVCTPKLNIEVTLVDVSNAGGTLPSTAMATLVPSVGSGFVSFGSEVMGVEPQPFHVEYHLAYVSPDPMTPPPDDQAPELDWSVGQAYFELKVDVLTDGGFETLTLFGEPLPGQSIAFANVVATQGGSTVLAVDVSGSGDDPALHLSLGGQFTASTGLPALGPWPAAGLVAAMLMVGVRMVRRRGAAVAS